MMNAAARLEIFIFFPLLFKLKVKDWFVIWMENDTLIVPCEKLYTKSISNIAFENNTWIKKQPLLSRSWSCYWEFNILSACNLV